MKAFAAFALLAVGVFASPAAARDMSTLWTTLNDTAPRTIFDDIRDSAPRSFFDQLNDTAPRAAPEAASADDRIVGE
jgi:hypothetical protein